ncbi:hypothetical protein QL285_076622 [Trifolium repens]|nr:hypothetical protein QL285_076622 [Trifolium repens]
MLRVRASASAGCAGHRLNSPKNHSFSFPKLKTATNPSFSVELELLDSFSCEVFLIFVNRNSQISPGNSQISPQNSSISQISPQNSWISQIYVSLSLIYTAMAVILVDARFVAATVECGARSRR